MRIISWNCNRKFREKFREISEYNADIYVIQECENPNRYLNSDYFLFAENSFWIGENQASGLGIFAKKQVILRKNDWPCYCLRNFLSVNVNEKFDLLGVWACKPYIEEYYICQSINFEKYNEEMVIIGDFNSNAQGDKLHGNRSYSAVVKELKIKQLESAYHYLYKEKQGRESQGSFYQYRHKDKMSHIDYCFINPIKIKNFQILNKDKWLELSDHLPLLIDIIDR